ncbi:hypothetical protein JX266_004538 [Neoarthrinium moseri]|nr:hypothetical protein JX266_004538 [Neoarthrinium moseri]
MATLQPGPAYEPPYPSWRERKSDGGVVIAPHARRLFWPLDGEYPAAISVMRTVHSANELKPFFQPAAEDMASGTWHEIAHLPLTEPKVSSIDASIHDFHQWEVDWVRRHSEHTGLECNPEWVTYGDLNDEDRPYANEPKEDGSWEEDSDTEFLLRCCGEDRPMRKRELKLTVTPSAGNDFVTVHDYVSVVHPWLMSLRDDILKAKQVAQFQMYPVPAAKEWMVEQGPYHDILEKESWVQRYGDGPPRQLSASSQAFLEKIRRSRIR